MKYSELADEIPWCCGCRKPRDGTIVLAHRNLNAWGLLFGKGIKSLSVLGAFLCAACHSYGDGDGRKDSAWWEAATHRSITWAYNSGYLSFATLDEPDKRLR